MELYVRFVKNLGNTERPRERRAPAQQQKPAQPPPPDGFELSPQPSEW
ncbi:MAG TPA: hypothetical protein VFK05_28735 [Polyangiaceae bacterium]|nr:hypothetical protein [Polyangiaceae bacterium]